MIENSPYNHCSSVSIYKVFPRNLVNILKTSETIFTNYFFFQMYQIVNQPYNYCIQAILVLSYVQLYEIKVDPFQVIKLKLGSKNIVSHACSFAIKQKIS